MDLQTSSKLAGTGITVFVAKKFILSTGVEGGVEDGVLLRVEGGVLLRVEGGVEDGVL